MRAVDTNILARFLTADDPAQTGTARRILEEPFFVAKTVLLELEWVLRRIYRKPRADILAVFDALLRHDNASFEDPAAIARALEWSGAGIDFADALHLASAPAGAAFATFDQALARLARAAGGTPKIAAV